MNNPLDVITLHKTFLDEADIILFGYESKKEHHITCTRGKSLK